MSDAESKMWAKNYVWRMAESKDRIKPETKARMRREFEDSVLYYALEIKINRAREYMRRTQNDPVQD